MFDLSVHNVAKIRCVEERAKGGTLWTRVEFCDREGRNIGQVTVFSATARSWAEFNYHADENDRG